MKKKLLYILTGCMLITVSCEQEPIALQAPEEHPSTTGCSECPAGASPGDIDLTKFIAIGNSFVAGMQAGALFTDGQNNSLAAMISKQMECVGGSATFNQPDINASLGWNLFITQKVLTDPTQPVLGRMLLQYGDNVSCATGAPSPLPTPQAYGVGELEAVPNPGVNPGFLYSGTKADLNNFAIPAIQLGQALIPQTGAWAGAGSDPRFNPFYGRLAYPGTGTSTIIGDAAAAGGTFFMFWLGLDDFFLHAAYGGDSNYAPLTPGANFGAYFGAALDPASGLLAVVPKGVVGNFPDIFVMPHFKAVSYNPIPLDEDQAGELNGQDDDPDAPFYKSGFYGYNALLDAISANPTLLTNFGLDADELQSRKLAFEASCTNKILMVDETLDDLGNVFDYLRSVGAIPSDAARAALVPYEQVRHSAATDVIPLSAGSVLGEAGTFGVLGVSEPVGDRYVIIPTEKDAIVAARLDYNQRIADYVDLINSDFPDEPLLALADVNAAFEALTTAGAAIINGVTITPKIDPPAGIYSEDGVHPNTRGYAFISNIFINAINAQWGSQIPQTCINEYSATALPIP